MTRTILVVDDNEANLRLINAVLKTRGYQLMETTSGEGRPRGDPRRRLQ